MKGAKIKVRVRVRVRVRKGRHTWWVGWLDGGMKVVHTMDRCLIASIAITSRIMSDTNEGREQERERG